MSQGFKQGLVSVVMSSWGVMSAYGIFVYMYIYCLSFSMVVAKNIHHGS